MRVREGTTYSQMYPHGTVWSCRCNSFVQVRQIVLYTYVYYACIELCFMHRCLAVAAFLWVHAVRREPLTCGVTIVKHAKSSVDLLLYEHAR